MLTKTEKIALLRSVSLFAETPDKILAQIVPLLQSIEVQAGTTVIRKGDRGDCMYIVLEGRIRVHDGNRTLNFLGAADVVGEMALLDAQPRTASVTAVEDSQLFRLDQSIFYKLMADRAEVSIGILHVLCRRLRERLRDMAKDFEYIQQMERITASAAALETGRYDPRSLDEVSLRGDALGQLARVFQRMANEVVARELFLKREIETLRIEIDEAKKAQEVAQITETDAFKELQRQAQASRKKFARRS